MKTLKLQDKPALRLRPIALMAMLMSGTQPVLAQTYDDRAYLAPMFSYALADDERESDDGYGGVLALGKRFNPQFELEIRGQYLGYEAHDTRPLLLGIPIGDKPEDYEITAGGLGANLFFARSGKGLFLHLDAMGGSNTLLNAGLGIDLGGENLALRLEALYHSDDGDYQETQFNVGLRIPLGSKHVPPPPPPPAVVAPVTPPPACSDGRDNDGDGLTDYPADPGCMSATDNDEFNTPSCESTQPGQPVHIDGCDDGATIILNGVYFEFDKATLTPDSREILDGVVAALQAHPEIIVEIAGHTDWTGTDAYNQSLSQRRAASVMAYLAEHGILETRMSAVGYGESMPIADNATKEGRALNRRVELHIIEGSVSVAPAAAPAPVIAPTAYVEPVPAAEPTSSAEVAGAPVAMAPEPAAEPAAEPAPAPAAAPGTAAVSIGMMKFEPATLTVPAGTTVTWTNNDGSNHTVKFGSEVSPRLREGATYSKTFDAPGEYPYICSIHGQRMSGTIVVTP